MRSLVKISLALLALGFLAVAGSAYAQDAMMQKPTLQITGNINSSLGYVTWDKYQNAAADKGYSELVTSFEDNIRFQYGTDTLSGSMWLRTRGSSGGTENACSANGLSGTTNGAGVTSGTNSCPSNDNSSGSGVPGNGSRFLSNIYGTLTYKPMPALSIEVGQLRGWAPSDAITAYYYMSNPVAGVIDVGQDWTGSDGLKLEYNLGTFNVGFGLNSFCVPSCSTGSYSTFPNPGAASNGAPTALQNTPPSAGKTGTPGTFTFQNTMTEALVAYGDVGPIGFVGLYSMASGDISYLKTATSSGTRTETGTAYNLGAQFKGVPGFLIGLDIQGNAQANDSTLCPKTSTTCHDTAQDLISFDVQYMGFDLNYVDQTIKKASAVNTVTNSFQQELTDIIIAYKWAVGPGFIIPEYDNHSLTNVKQTLAATPTFKTATDSLLKVGFRVVY